MEFSSSAPYPSLISGTRMPTAKLHLFRNEHAYTFGRQSNFFAAAKTLFLGLCELKPEKCHEPNVEATRSLL